MQGTSQSILTKFITDDEQIKFEHLLENYVSRQLERIAITLSYSFPKIMISELIITGDIRRL